MIYPAVLTSLLSIGLSRQRIVVVLAIACLAALAWRMHLVSLPNFETKRTFFGSDTRVDCMFAASGCSSPFDHLQHLRGWVVSNDSARPTMSKRKAHVPGAAAEIQYMVKMELTRQGLEPFQVSARSVHVLVK